MSNAATALGTPLPPPKSVLKLVFLTLFLDLVGFSIVFPVFPALARYYTSVDPGDPLLRGIFWIIAQFDVSQGDAAGNLQSMVLFGGILGALYSLLQFVCSPIWGKMSDRVGRRPVLMLSSIGMLLSYVLWMFAGSFTLLIIARIIGGAMSGNISVATAAVADVTTKETRSRGMAVVGIAFALGFVCGPAIGGILSLIDLSALAPDLWRYGINPFSTQALFASVLSAANLLVLSRFFKETLPPERRGQSHTARSANVIALFRPLPFRGANQTNYGYFLFLAAFSGMEFTLTFLAAERLDFTPMQNAGIFVYVGFLIALVQGGVVRRKAHVFGEKNMAFIGLLAVVPGLLLISQAYTSFMLYFGLSFLAFGSALSIPCLTSLASLYTPADAQGHALGVFRSLGALARVVGPLVASVLYWKYGSSSPYIAGVAFLFLPIALVFTLPPVSKDLTT